MTLSFRALAMSAGMILSALAAAPPASAKGPIIQTVDVTRFYQVYDAAHGLPTSAQLDLEYLAPGTQALHEFAQLREVTGARIVKTNDKSPQVYSDARRCLAVMPAVKRRLTAAFDTLARLYSEAKFPPVTLLIGRGRPIGITSPAGVTIGLEAMCAADFMNPNLEDRFVHAIAHEYGHIQQPPEIQALEEGMPGATLLRMALIEGVAEFTAELISGDVGEYQLKSWTKGHEAAIEAAFIADEDKTDLSAWLNNGPGTPEKPGDLAYWVGKRIVKTYYEHATDKHQALHDIYNIEDPKAFLTRSGWRPLGQAR